MHKFNPNQAGMVTRALIFILMVASLQGLSQNKLSIADANGKKLWSVPKPGPLNIISTDSSRNENPKERDGISIRVISETEPEGETILLMETGENTGVFSKTIQLIEAPKAVAKDGSLQISVGDKISVIYTESITSGSEPQHFDEAFYKGPGWTFLNTGENHIVLLPDYAVITIDGKPISKGDFVGAFFETEKNGKKEFMNASGTGRDIAPGGVCWKGVTAATAVWGTQPGKKNGFATGETLRWKIWRAADGKVFDATAEYLEGQNFPDKGNYVKDGISGLKKLTAVSPK